jgi:hypothetical protein
MYSGFPRLLEPVALQKQWQLRELTSKMIRSIVRRYLTFLVTIGWLGGLYQSDRIGLTPSRERPPGIPWRLTLRERLSCYVFIPTTWNRKDHRFGYIWSETIAVKELVKVGLVQDSGCKIHSAQAAGCAPMIMRFLTAAV